MKTLHEQIYFAKQMIIRILSDDKPDMQKAENGLERLKELTEQLPMLPTKEDYPDVTRT